MDLSSLLFISSMALVNADGNITSINLTNNTSGVYEINPLARPLAAGDTHYINNAIGITACVIAHDELKNLDTSIGLKDTFGTRDIFSIGIGALECYTISTWTQYRKADIGWEIGLSEVEFLVTTSVFHIEF